MAKLGHIWIKAKIGDQQKKRTVEVDAIVDTGATLTVIPEKLAKELSLQITGRTEVETGTGKIELPRSRIWIEIEKSSDIVPVLISNIIDKVLIGVTTLEILGLAVDPITGKLKKWTILLYQHIKTP